jgi:hypothetical protein
MQFSAQKYFNLASLIFVQQIILTVQVIPILIQLTGIMH